jgi:hypothetical protein
MIATALNRLDWTKLHLTQRDYLRGVLAGSAWGLTVTAGLAAMSAWEYGGICVPELVVNTGLSLAGGILAIGPVAAYGGRR